MERKEYLEWCRACAMIPLKGGFVPPVPDSLKVTYDAGTYIPYRYELGFDEAGKVIHTAILHDLRANALVYARLDKVFKYLSSEHQRNRGGNHDEL